MENMSELHKRLWLLSFLHCLSCDGHDMELMQASTSLLGGMGNGGLKGLASNTLERRLVSSDSGQLPQQLARTSHHAARSPGDMDPLGSEVSPQRRRAYLAAFLKGHLSNRGSHSLRLLVICTCLKGGPPASDRVGLS